MNKATKAVLSEMIVLLGKCQRLLDAESMHMPLQGEIKAGVEKVRALIDPPVRFVWTKLQNADVYRSNVGEGYSIGHTRWNEWTASTSGKIGGYIHLGTFRTLASAKQACVDHGVAAAKARREAAGKGGA